MPHLEHFPGVWVSDDFDGSEGSQEGFVFCTNLLRFNCPHGPSGRIAGIYSEGSKTLRLVAWLAGSQDIRLSLRSSLPCSRRPLSHIQMDDSAAVAHVTLIANTAE